MEKRITLEYGEGHLELELSDNYQVLQSNINNKKIDWDDKIKQSFSQPIDSATLSKIVADERSEQVVILVNDITRPVKYDIVLKPMLAELLEAGIQSENITLLIATGMHRPMTAQEVESTLGKEISENFNWQNHLCEENLVYYGELSEGVPLYVNSLVKEADLL